MAKISARGAHTIERYTTKTGTQYLLRSDDVILRKLLPTDGWSIVRNTKLPTPALWDWIKKT